MIFFQQKQIDNKKKIKPDVSFNNSKIFNLKNMYCEHSEMKLGDFFQDVP